MRSLEEQYIHGIYLPECLNGFLGENSDYDDLSVQIPEKSPKKLRQNKKKSVKKGKDHAK